MFNADSLIAVLRNAIIETEVQTTRQLADEIRKLPAGFPPSEIADMLDAVADQVNDAHAPPEHLPVSASEPAEPGTLKNPGSTRTTGPAR